MARFIIYGLTDPRSGEIRYVGKSTSGLKRPAHHRSASALAKPSHRTNWIKSLLALGLDYGIAVLAEGGDAKALDALEIRWIAHGRAEGWPLTNVTDGGGGRTGLPHLDETKLKMAEAARRRSPPSAETRAKISAARLALPKRPRAPRVRRRDPVEVRARRSEAQRSRDPATRAAALAALHSPVVKGRASKAVAEANRRRVVSDAAREKMSKSRKGRKHSPETRARMSAAKLGHVQSEETRAKISAARRKTSTK